MAELTHLQAIMHVSFQLSKASETSECVEDLQASNRSDRELIQHMVSRQKSLVPWAWALHSLGTCSQCEVTAISCSHCPDSPLSSDITAVAQATNVNLCVALVFGGGS